MLGDRGSGAGTGQGFAPGAQLVRYEYTSLLVDITGNVWAVGDGTSTQIFRGVIDYLWPPPDEELLALTLTAAGADLTLSSLEESTAVSA